MGNKMDERVVEMIYFCAVWAVLAIDGFSDACC